MKRYLTAALAGIRAEASYGGGWQSLLETASWSSGSYGSVAGQTVSAQKAMTLSAVWDCVRKTAEMVSVLPLDHYRKMPNGKREKIDSPLSDILKHSPNAEQTAFEFLEGMVGQTSLNGNAVAEKQFIGSRLVALRHLRDTKPERGQDGRLRYRVYDRGKVEYLPPEKVLHLRGFGGGNGIGLSTIKYGANSLGAALAADEASGSVFSNAGMPSGVLTSDQSLNKDQRSQLGKIMDAFTGSKKAGKILILEAGLQWNQAQMNPEDAQMLETRRFSVEDVCRWFGVPPIVIGHASDGQTMWGSGVEAILLAWLTLGVNPLLTRIEARLMKDLLTPQQRRNEYLEFNREAMIQMDSKAKGDLMLKLGMGGTMTANERRDRLNLPRHDDPNADALLAQTALAPLELLGKDKK